MAAEIDIKKLKVIYDSLEDMLKCDDYGKDLQRELSKYCTNYMNVLESAKRDLLRNDCSIVVAGETSAGKSTLINTLVGPVGKRPLFKSAILAATAAITRIRNSDELCIKACTKDEVLIKEERFNDRKALRSAIQKLTDMEKMSADMKKDLHFLDVYLPVPILEGNITIVDTPGVGENKTLDTMLIDFLQHAVAFVIIVNCRNAGGITCDRLGTILKAILENRRKMPCFDTNDVLFLTNQWDRIEQDATLQYSSDSDSTEEESEVELVWKKVKMNITDIWGELPLKNIFQISLRQVQEGTSSKYTEEYKRFEKKLKKTIDRNKNKRVQFYFEFIQRFHEKANKEAIARLTLLVRSEEEHMKKMIENQEKIYQLEKDCKKRRGQMEQCKRKLVEELCQKLKGYLHSSSGQHEVLNPPGEREIRNVFEVSRRLSNGINRWCEKDETQATLVEANEMIRCHLDYIESQMKSIWFGLLGLNSIKTVEISKSLLDLEFTIGLKTFSLSDKIVMPLNSPMLNFYGWFHTEHFRNMANKNYLEFVSKISPDQLRQEFYNSIGKEFNRVIVDIFDDAVPKKIQNVLTISSRKLQDEYNDNKAKRDSIMRRKINIDEIGKKVEEFQRACNSV